jgi:ketosteroid isomerase-like protein
VVAETSAEAAGQESGAQVRAAEAAFTAMAAAEGAAAAYAAHADPGLRLYRDGSPPWLGRETALAAVAAESGRLECRPQAVGAARSGDLGWAWGEGRREAPAAGAGEATDLSWLRIWRRAQDGVWRIVVDVALPVPAEEAGGGS